MQLDRKWTGKWRLRLRLLMMFDGETATVELAFMARCGMLAERPACRRLSRVCIDNGALTRFISETDFR